VKRVRDRAVASDEGRAELPDATRYALSLL
jgi:hypothetical protein